MSRLGNRRRHHRPLAVCVLLMTAAVAAPALGAFDSLRTFGQAGAGAGGIGPHAPAISVDALGRVYVADIGEDRVEAFSNHGAPDGGWGGLRAPGGVAAAPDDSVVVSDRSGVHRYDAGGARIQASSPRSPAGA